MSQEKNIQDFLAPEIFFIIFFDEIEIKKISVLYLVNKFFYAMGEKYFETQVKNEFSLDKKQNNTSWLQIYRKNYNTQYINTVKGFKVTCSNLFFTDIQSDLVRWVKLRRLEKIIQLKTTLADWTRKNSRGYSAITYAGENGFIEGLNYFFRRFIEPNKTTLFEDTSNFKIPWINYTDAAIACHQNELVKTLEIQSQELSKKSSAQVISTLRNDTIGRYTDISDECKEELIEEFNQKMNNPRERYISFYIRTAIENNNLEYVFKLLKDFYGDNFMWYEENRLHYSLEILHDYLTIFTSHSGILYEYDKYETVVSYLYDNENIVRSLFYLGLKYNRLQLIDFLLEENALKWSDLEKNDGSEESKFSGDPKNIFIGEVIDAASELGRYQLVNEKIFPLYRKNKYFLHYLLLVSIKTGWIDLVKKILEEIEKNKEDFNIDDYRYYYGDYKVFLLNAKDISGNLKCHEIMFQFFFKKNEIKYYYNYFLRYMEELVEYELGIVDYGFFQYFVRKLKTSPECIQCYINELKLEHIITNSIFLIHKMLNLSAKSPEFFELLKEFLTILFDNKVDLGKFYKENKFINYRFFNTAVRTGNIELVQCLLNIEFDPTVPDNKDKIAPLEIARSKVEEYQKILSDPDNMQSLSQIKEIEENLQKWTAILKVLFKKTQSLKLTKNKDREKNQALSTPESSEDDFDESYSFNSYDI